VLWLVRGSKGDPVATAVLRRDTSEAGSHLAEVEMTVHPAHRRLGIGSRLLATVTEAVTAAGCRSLVAEVAAATSGESFLATRGFRPVLRLSHLRLALDDVPEQIRELPERPHPGYRLTAWSGVVPDPLAASFSAARQGMADMPVGGLDSGPPEWDEDRVRAAAETLARRGERLETVAALAEADGSVAGYTELVLPADSHFPAQQSDTTVLPAHRGHGLGLWMKAAMLRRLRAEHPDTTEIRANNADDNRHMLAVNTALGFRPRRRTVMYQLSLRAR
jgi:GNAT superfamily N-acetyltransferase